MKKTIVGIFAHPDDEAFGPAGTLAMYAADHDVYLICVTDGETQARYKTSDHATLKEVRDKELLSSSQVLGIKEVFFMGYQDGGLSNNLYHEIADSIQQKLDELKPDTVITFEPRGVSGHIDHIAVTMIASYLWQKLDYVKRIMYFCISESERKKHDDYFIYMPPGYSPSQVDTVVDVTSVWDKKIAAINKHVSQKADIRKFVPIISSLPKQELFIVKSK